jgi:Pyruvate/2-oxoacid:ferredoxin oxidoreductase delta subunit
LEGDGPTYGDRFDLNLVVSGKDLVAVDKVCSQIIGISWEELDYLRISDESLNQIDIEVVGESLGDVKTSFSIPRKSAFYHFAAWMIYALDIPFSKIFAKHFNQFLYSTGYVGTNPKIIQAKCDKCGDCVKVCPEENVLDIEHYKINYKDCIRCLNCFQTCNRNAIFVKGVSHPKER